MNVTTGICTLNKDETPSSLVGLSPDGTVEAAIDLRNSTGTWYPVLIVSGFSPKHPPVHVEIQDVEMIRVLRDLLNLHFPKGGE